GAQAVVQLSDKAILLDRGEVLCAGRPKFVVNKYLRLLNASPAEQENLRAQILASALQEQKQEQEQVQHNQCGAPSVETATETAAAAVVAAPASEEGYDPALAASASAVTRLEERGARILDVRITTLHGTKVILLQMCTSYRLDYEVAFDQGATQVGMGFGIRTISV